MSPLVAAGLLAPQVRLAGPLGPRPERVRVEPRGSGIVCVTATFAGVQTLPRLRKVASQLRALQGCDRRLLRWAVGLDLPPRGLAITLWDEVPPGCLDILAGADWVGTWDAADYEIGHWDGLRLRLAARRRMRDRVGDGQ